jgi:ABC-type molybdate transport system substrate-binding protein
LPVSRRDEGETDRTFHIGFAAGLSAAAKQPQAAKALIGFLSAPAAAATLKAKGVEPH